MGFHLVGKKITGKGANKGEEEEKEKHTSSNIP